METLYILVICAGITGWGCGMWSDSPPMSKAECYDALAHVRFDVDNPGEGRRSAIAYCHPTHTRGQPNED